MKPKQNISRYIGYFCAKFNSNRFSRFCVVEPQITKEGDGRWLLWTHDGGGRGGGNETAGQVGEKLAREE